MTRRLAWLAVPLLGLMVLSGCGKPEPSAPPEVRTGVPSESYTPDGDVPPTVPMPTVRNAPDAVEGESPEAMVVAAQRFIEMWAVYNPSGWEAKEHWFKSWEAEVTGPFRQKMRVDFDNLWAWTWAEEKSVCCVQFSDDGEAAVAEDAAVAKIAISRSVQPLFATEAEIKKGMEEERLTYLVYFQRSGGVLRVSDVRQVNAKAALPEVE